MGRDDKPSELAEAALALDGELRKFEDLAEQAGRLKLSTEKNLERATEALTRAAESQDRIRGHVQDLVAAVAATRQRQEGDAAALMKQLATRVTFDVPQALLEREIDRRVEEFVRRLIDQQIDPMKTNINWEEFRERQSEAAAESVRGALVLDEVARREQVAVATEDVDAEIARYAERTGRTPAAVRARLEKEGGISRLYAGLRRERAIDFLLSRATIVQT